MSTNIPGIQVAQLGLWLPEPNDSLAQTMCKVYGVSMIDPILKDLVALHMTLNPDIFSAQRPLNQKVIYLADLQIYRGAVLGPRQQAAMLSKLNIDKAKLAGSKTRLEAVVPSNPAEVEAMRFTLGFNEVIGHIGTGIGIGSSTASTLTGKHLHADILTFNRWSSEKAALMKGGKNKDILHHYDARMDDVVRRIQNRLGPTERFLFKGSAKDALFNGVPQSLKPEPITISAAERIKQVASASKIFGAALVVVDTGLMCDKLTVTAEKDKLETAYREIGGIAGTLFTGFAVGLTVTAMATPVGWVGGIVISAGTAYGGKALGESVFNMIYNSTGDFFHLKDGRFINKWCK